MKKIIASIGTYGLYYLGDFVSLWMWNDWSYNLYKNLMYWSGRVQDWGDLDKPWENVKCPSCGRSKESPKFSCYNQFHKSGVSPLEFYKPTVLPKGLTESFTNFLKRVFK